MSKTYICRIFSYYLDHRSNEPPQSLDDAQLATLKHKREVELHMWGILKELLVYSLYASVIFTMSFENKDPSMYRTNEYIKTLLGSIQVEQVS